MTDGKRRSANRSVKGDEQSAINGHFEQRGADFFFGQQSMSAGIAALMPGACEGEADDAGPAIKPASMQIATTKRMKALERTPDDRTVGGAGQCKAGRQLEGDVAARFLATLMARHG